MRYRPRVPTTGGWLEVELNQQEIDHLWKCIENQGEDAKRYIQKFFN